METGGDRWVGGGRCNRYIESIACSSIAIGPSAGQRKSAEGSYRELSLAEAYDESQAEAERALRRDRGRDRRRRPRSSSLSPAASVAARQLRKVRAGGADLLATLFKSRYAPRNVTSRHRVGYHLSSSWSIDTV